MVRITIVKVVNDCGCGLMEEVLTEIFDLTDADILPVFKNLVDAGLVADMTIDDYFSGKIKILKEELVQI